MHVNNNLINASFIDSSLIEEKKDNNDESPTQNIQVRGNLNVLNEIKEKRAEDRHQKNMMEFDFSEFEEINVNESKESLEKHSVKVDSVKVDPVKVKEKEKKASLFHELSEEKQNYLVATKQIYTNPDLIKKLDKVDAKKEILSFPNLTTEGKKIYLDLHYQNFGSQNVHQLSMNLGIGVYTKEDENNKVDIPKCDDKLFFDLRPETRQIEKQMKKQNDFIKFSNYSKDTKQKILQDHYDKLGHDSVKALAEEFNVKVYTKDDFKNEIKLPKLDNNFFDIR